MTNFIIIAIIWVLGIYPVYSKYMKYQDMSKFEMIWLSCIWPALIPLYIIHFIHNRF